MTHHSSLFDLLETAGAPRCTFFSDPASGLRAVLVIDDLTLGPAVGGIRTRSYPSLEAAVADAAALARAMTIKCALGGIDAGGAKAVVLDHPGLKRGPAFRRLGELVAELDGRFITAGDLGTTADDLASMAAVCPYVHTGEAELSRSVARGLVRCAEACAQAAGRPGLAGLRIADQGCGAIGAAAARAFAAAGAALVLADIAAERAHALAAELDADVVPADAILFADVDLVSPCAVGGVITAPVVDALRAWAVCGAANNIVADAAAHARLGARGILHVPDVVASAGAVVDGVGQMVMGLADRTPLIDALGATAAALLAESRRTGISAAKLAEERAFARISACRRQRAQVDVTVE